MKATAKNTANGLVVSNESPIFALPRIPYGNIQSHTKPFWAYSCCTSGNPVSGFLAELTGYALFVSSPLCVQPCQEPTQSIWRSIVTRLHLVMSIASSRIGRHCGLISKNPTSFGWKFTVIRRRLFIAMLRLSRPARRYWRLVQQSSSSSDAVLPSASTISLSAAASSPNLKSFAL